MNKVYKLIVYSSDDNPETILGYYSSRENAYKMLCIYCNEADIDVNSLKEGLDFDFDVYDVDVDVYVDENMEELLNYIPTLKQIQNNINMKDVIEFLNEKDVDYYGWNDIQMIIEYIKLK